MRFFFFLKPNHGFCGDAVIVVRFFAIFATLRCGLCSPLPPYVELFDILEVDLPPKWIEKWIGDKSLQDLFPRMFALELDKEVLVTDKMNVVAGHSFRRPVRAGSEHQQMVDLNSLLESVSLSQSHDRWFCDLTGGG
nr:RNA-directed DNA polymerase, eukaryota, reverse transcriptase zinc-binding domain protein [Tanacetum cinerariifolium]GEZ67642.1 RNA-directed DNA polymerase, eukaryota, reverse transcriptase zinc-binding domain protein [Tanacetum cinerariifolium]